MNKEVWKIRSYLIYNRRNSINLDKAKQLVIDALLELKAKDVLVLEIESSVCDLMVIATATSTIHSSALVNNLIKRAKSSSLPSLGTEGTRDHQWVLVDLGEIIIHIMLPEQREFYQLEKLWQPIALNSHHIVDNDLSASA